MYDLGSFSGIMYFTYCLRAAIRPVSPLSVCPRLSFISKHEASFLLLLLSLYTLSPMKSANNRAAALLFLLNNVAFNWDSVKMSE